MRNINCFEVLNEIKTRSCPNYSQSLFLEALSIVDFIDLKFKFTG